MAVLAVSSLAEPIFAKLDGGRGFAAWQYSHPTLQALLDAGVRSLELDAYYDPVGGEGHTTPLCSFFEHAQGLVGGTPAQLHR